MKDIYLKAAEWLNKIEKHGDIYYGCCDAISFCVTGDHYETGLVAAAIQRFEATYRPDAHPKKSNTVYWAGELNHKNNDFRVMLLLFMHWYDTMTD